jgi:hypothetical protein
MPYETMVRLKIRPTIRASRTTCASGKNRAAVEVIRQLFEEEDPPRRRLSRGVIKLVKV